MALVSNFPAERDWNVVIDALMAAIMSGTVTSVIETRTGVTLCDDSGVEIVAIKKI